MTWYSHSHSPILNFAHNSNSSQFPSAIPIPTVNVMSSGNMYGKYRVHYTSVQQTSDMYNNITRNKSNASFEAVQYRQDMRHIAHYHNIKNLACLYTLLRKSE